MEDKDFLDFLNSTAKKGGATFNLKSCSVSKAAREILEASDFKILAKQHINSNIKAAYNNNTAFKTKMNEVMDDLHITVIA